MFEKIYRFGQRHLIPALVTVGIMSAGSAMLVSAADNVTYYACNLKGVLYNVGTTQPTCANGSTLMNWNQLGSMGPAGPKGDKGDTGAVGPQGLKGDKGDNGDTGPGGPQGPKGDKGDAGDTGPAGPQGPQGIKGDAGDVGPAGPPGAQGPKGDIGPQGLQGPQGDKGDVGPAGPQGLKGDTGAVGPAGPQGLQGDTGSAGPQGPKGDKGDTGAAGPQGPAGVSGWQFVYLNGWVDPGATVNLYAACQATQKVLGGGFEHGTSLLVNTNAPAQVAVGDVFLWSWRVNLTNPSTVRLPATAYAICANAN